MRFPYVFGLLALAGCSSQPVRLDWAGLYVDGGLQVKQIGEIVERSTLIDSPNIQEPILVSEHTSRSPQNPYGRAAIGYEVAFQRATLSLEASHVSSVSTGRDIGINALTLNVRWYPFRRSCSARRRPSRMTFDRAAVRCRTSACMRTTFACASGRRERSVRAAGCRRRLKRC